MRNDVPDAMAERSNKNQELDKFFDQNEEQESDDEVEDTCQ